MTDATIKRKVGLKNAASLQKSVKHSAGTAELALVFLRYFLMSNEKRFVLT